MITKRVHHVRLAANVPLPTRGQLEILTVINGQPPGTKIDAKLIARELKITPETARQRLWRMADEGILVRLQRGYGVPR